MSTSTELEDLVSNGQRIFVRIPASELSHKEAWFRKYRPKTKQEKEFYKRVKKVIKMGVKDFYRPVIDPSFNEDGKTIGYVPGRKPATGKTYPWWKKTANNFKPECRSRLGNKFEYIAFLAVLIKSLVASGWRIKDAWYAVSYDSKDLGHYTNSKRAKYEFENTGSREICKVYDLANTYKLLAEDEEEGGLWIASGFCNGVSDVTPLARLCHFYLRCNIDYDSTGWIVLEKSPYEET